MRRTRKEDLHLITGHSTYTDNLLAPGMVHLAILRSPIAHAKMCGIWVAECTVTPSSSGSTSTERGSMNAGATR